MRRPLKLSDVRLEDYDAVYLPGGHGPMADLAFDADVGRLLTAQLASGNPLFIVCHGPASMLATRIHGVSPFKGYRVTCFTNEEEEAVGLASRATWLLETELKEKVGVDFSRGEIWKPYMVEDRNLVTGQNPDSAAVLGSGCWRSSQSAARLLNSRSCESDSRSQCRRRCEPAGRSPAICTQEENRFSGNQNTWDMSVCPPCRKESSMAAVQIEQKSYEMPPREGISVAHFLTVADIDRSVRFYETVFGGRILSRGDSKGAPAYIQIANIWLIVNVGGGPTPDKPTVTLSVPDPDHDQQLYEYPRCGYSSVLRIMEKSRSRVHHGADPQVRRDALLHPRS